MPRPVRGFWRVRSKYCFVRIPDRINNSVANTIEGGGECPLSLCTLHLKVDRERTTLLILAYEHINPDTDTRSTTLCQMLKVGGGNTTPPPVYAQHKGRSCGDYQANTGL